MLRTDLFPSSVTSIVAGGEPRTDGDGEAHSEHPLEDDPGAGARSGEATLTERERKRLLDATRRPSGTVGESVPEELAVLGTTIDLRELVFECRRLDAIPDEERERIEALKLDLKRERLARVRRIEDGDVALEEGERLVRSIRGIDRALTALDGLDTPSIGEQVRRQEIESARELQALVDLKRRLDGGRGP